MKIRTCFCLIVSLALLGSSSVLADYDAGMEHLKAGKYMEAAAEFQTIVDENPGWSDGFQLLGICFLKTGKHAEAEQNFIKAIELDPEKFAYHYNLANAYQAQKKWPQVVATANTAEELAADNQKPALYKLRGNALATQRKWAEAIPDLDKAARAKPDAAVQAQLGKAYFGVGDNPKSVAALEKAVQLDPKNAQAFELMAEALLQMGPRATNEADKKRTYKRAREAAESYAALKPGSAGGRYLVGRAALGAGDYRQAVDALRVVVDKKPDNCNAMANLGKAFTALEDWPNALTSLENATTCAPKMAVAWESKGWVLQKQKRYADAIAAYERAKSIKPSKAAEENIRICRENMEIKKHNRNQDAEAAAQAAEIEAERLRVEEEERKRKEYEEKNRDG